MAISSFPGSVAVVIPAWQPPTELIPIVQSLCDSGCTTVLLVDDGSSSRCQPVFDRLRNHPATTLLRHPRNAGKGRAVKTGLAHFVSACSGYTGIVSADADGQHSVEDISSVAQALVDHPQQLILGSRRPAPEMPLRSRFGNALTRHVFRALSGVMLTDTQTGLRGFPTSMLPHLLALPGERYEYEMAVLLDYCRSGRIPVEIPIRTIYQQHNSSSHFRPVLDSFHIYRVLAQSILRAQPARHPQPQKAHSAPV